MFKSLDPGQKISVTGIVAVIVVAIGGVAWFYSDKPDKFKVYQGAAGIPGEAGPDAEDNGGEGPAGGALPAESARVLAEACPVPADAGATPAAAEACELRAMGGDTGPADAGGDSGSAPQSPPQRRPPVWYR